MSSFEERFYRTNPGALERLRRNTSLLFYVATDLLAWFTVGRKVRKAHRRALETNQVVVLEDIVPGDDE